MMLLWNFLLIVLELTIYSAHGYFQTMLYYFVGRESSYNKLVFKLCYIALHSNATIHFIAYNILKYTFIYMCTQTIIHTVVTITLETLLVMNLKIRKWRVWGAGETAQSLRAPAALPQDLVSVPTSSWWLTTTCTSSSRWSDPPLLTSAGTMTMCATHMYIQAKPSHT